MSIAQSLAQVLVNSRRHTDDTSLGILAIAREPAILLKE